MLRAFILTETKRLGITSGPMKLELESLATHL